MKFTKVQVVCTLLSLALLAIPIGLGLRWWPPAIARQGSVPNVTLSDAQLAHYTAESSAKDAGPVILAYHDIQPNPPKDKTYTVPTDHFAEQMKMLKAAGYTSLTAQQLVDYTNGAPVPPKSVVITFDDGTRGMYTQADPVLAENGFHALCFVITGSVSKHQPYYLRWSELHAMQGSGRWDLEAHTHKGHNRVRIGPFSETGPFLTNRKLVGKNKFETPEQWKTRVSTDLDNNIAAFAQQGLPRPHIFAYPFSSAASSSNDPTTTSTLDAMIKERFALSLVNDGGAGAVTSRDVSLHTLPRVEVFQNTTTDALYARITALDLAAVGNSEFGDATRWATSSGQTVDPKWFQDEKIAFEVPEDKTDWLTFAPGATSRWHDYIASVDVSNLVQQNGAALEVLTGSDASLRVEVKTDKVHVDRGRGGTPLVDRSLPVAKTRHLEIYVGAFEVTVRVDGEMIYDGPTNPDANAQAPRGGIALGIDQQAGSDDNPRFEHVQVGPIVPK